MKLIKDKILIRITAELRESIYAKEIVSSSGEKMKLWKSAKETDYLDERASFLNVQTAIVEDVSDKITWIKKGDIALINYDICNSPQRLVCYEGEDTILYLDANTTYHQEDEIAWQTQRTKRDQIIHLKGDYDELSGLLGIIRNDELIANAPYIFFKHESNVQTMVSGSGMMYEKTQKIIEREVLAVSQETSEKYGIKAGDILTLDDFDTFDIKLTEDLAITAINDCDVLLAP